MLTTIPLDNASALEQWDAFVESHPRGTPYHLSCWLRTIYDTYSFDPLLYTFKNEKGELTGVFPCFRVKGLLGRPRIISLPFSDYGGPLFLDPSEERAAVQEVIERHGKDTKCIESRGPVPDDTGFLRQTYYKRHILDLRKELGELRKKLDKRTIQYSIRKAERAGIEVSEENTPRGLEEFHRLNKLTRKKHGVPSQPERFFRNLQDHVVSKGYGFLLLASRGRTVLAASFFLKFRGEAIHFKYNASSPEHLKRTTPNHLLTWHAIKQVHAQGYHWLDFGRTSPDNPGLLRYKAMWGSQSEELPYYYYPHTAGASSKEEGALLYRALTTAWRSLPDFVADRIGPVIYRRMA